MAIQLTCPGCGKVYTVDDEIAGRRANCPCGVKIPVPPAQSAALSEDPLSSVDAANSATSLHAPSPTADQVQTDKGAADPLKGQQADAIAANSHWGGATAGRRGLSFSRTTLIISCAVSTIVGVALGVVLAMLLR